MCFKLQESQEYEEGGPEYDNQGDDGQEHMEDYQECRNEDEYADEDQGQYQVHRLFPVQFTEFISIGIRHVLDEFWTIWNPLCFSCTIYLIFCIFYLQVGNGMEADAEEVEGGTEGEYDDGMQEGKEEAEGGEEVQAIDNDDDNDVVIVGTCTCITEVDLILKKKKRKKPTN